MKRSRNRLRAAALGVFLWATAFTVFDRNRPETHADILEHFKYGSIGAEDRAGLPYAIWLALPRLFPDYLPKRSGNGYERFGFVFETPKSVRPIGTSFRERQVGLVGLNCATCHTGLLRETPAAPRRIILGMPAHQFDLQSYQRFVFRCVTDPRFDADNVLRAIREVDPDFSWWDGLLYRLFVIPRTREEGRRLAATFAWFDARPPQGPGRVDTFNPYKVMFGFDIRQDTSVGTADLPSLWNQRPREGLWLHWDGNNNSVTERNKSAAIGAGASEASLDLPAMKRVEDWIWDLKPPPFPQDRIDRARAGSGKALYDEHCARCHAFGSARVGQVVEISGIGTDPERLNSFSPALVEKMNTIGAGRSWRFSHFRKTDGYTAAPLDGVWLRAPYLHNGSVPTLRDLLKAPDERPRAFRRGYDVYDFDAVGFVSMGPEVEKLGFYFDTSLRGNSNRGHTYGTDLEPSQKQDLLEYLKTL